MISRVTPSKQSRYTGSSLAEESRYRSFSAPSPLPNDPPPVTPYDFIYEDGKVRLRYYRAVGRAQPTPVLLVYALIKRPYIVDLVPDRSIVQAFVRQGFKLYLTDWIPPTDADCWRGFDAYVNGDLANAVRAVQSHAGVEHVSLLGYCLGGLLTALYTALHPKTVHTLITLALPLDLHLRELSSMSLAPALLPAVVDSILATYGNCPAWLIKAGITAVAPTRLLLPLYLLRDLREPEVSPGRWTAASLPLQRALAQWMNSDVPLAGQLFRELMIDIFLHDRLAQSQLQLGGQTVNLRHITCPVLNIIGEHDEVVPPTASLSLLELVGSHDARTLRLPTGHLGLAVSRAAHEKLWPQVAAWLREHEQKRVISRVQSGARPRRRLTSRTHEAGGL